ncbi:hypothetical protein E4U30_003310 [Claviceps sp. LM220 group G6]|nr:hypothetical protein E4U32_005964 [Claviceps aff. humidiphila group G2b]KAG6088862.1 hypothetical protein E4U15_004853 [Claviceps sp. LM218 group G6]KAG6100992.1 hypothetical protein E4U30_003310 [Claviceps sp. LM220 group G6]KAG6101439.1 hypothetical protein E4U31_003661 [Claviceps sp. LM219 group G6]KAG6111437.1 hypothetical protein E4U14_002476 [Claviceps sp. LM454 group G7]
MSKALKPEDVLLRLDLLATRAVFSGARPFTLFESEEMATLIDAIKKAPRFWKAPNRQKLSGVLLSKVYISVKAQVDEHINQAKSLNFTVDETTDIITKRIVNMSLITEGGAFLLYTLPVPTDGV